MTGQEWTPIKVDGYNGADIVTILGNGCTIKGLTKALFAGGASSENVPTVSLGAENVTDEGAELLNAMVVAGMVTSKSEARRAVEQGGVSVEGEKITDIKYVISKEALENGVLVKKGKKIFKKITL